MIVAGSFLSLFLLAAKWLVARGVVKMLSSCFTHPDIEVFRAWFLRFFLACVNNCPIKVLMLLCSSLEMALLTTLSWFHLTSTASFNPHSQTTAV